LPAGLWAAAEAAIAAALSFSCALWFACASECATAPDCVCDRECLRWLRCDAGCLVSRRRCCFPSTSHSPTTLTTIPSRWSARGSSSIGSRSC
jgi:hypothetical protein